MRTKTRSEHGNTYDHQKSSLNLELFIDPLVPGEVVPQLLVETIEPCCLDNMRREDLEKENIDIQSRIFIGCRMVTDRVFAMLC